MNFEHQKFSFHHILFLFYPALFTIFFVIKNKIKIIKNIENITIIIFGSANKAKINIATK